MCKRKDDIAGFIKPRKCLEPFLNHLGFTMIEVVVVLMVLFIVSTVIVSRSFTTGLHELMIETDGLKSSLRYAQIQALNDDTARWGIYIPNSTTYRLYKNDVDATSTMIPVKGSYGDPATGACPKNCHLLQGNVQITSPSSPKTINFDKWGRPMDGATLLGADFSITLGQGAQTNTITITKNTGYIQ